MPCEVIEGRRSSVEATVVSLSEGGLGIEAPLRVEQGDPITLRLLPRRGERSVTVEGIVWNDRPIRRSAKGTRLRLLGCILSDPPPDFNALIAEVEKRNAQPERRATPILRQRAEPSPEPEADLPRSRAPLPPPKPEPEESLPGFRVRLKQVEGPRTRTVVVRARSLADAEERARAELAASNGGATDGWEVLAVLPGSGAVSPRSS